MSYPSCDHSNSLVSRMAGLADANQSRLQLVDADLQNREVKER